MGRNLIETIMGTVVLLVAIFFLFFAYSQADLGAVKGYTLSASFGSDGGLPNGADVRINGVKVGTVGSQVIDTDNFNAVVHMTIRPDIHLPVDTVASVDTEGLLGGRFLKLVPGHSGSTIPAGGVITNTKTYQSLEEMVGQVIFLASDGGGGKPNQPAQQAAPATPAPTAPAPTAPAQTAPAPAPDAPFAPPLIATPGDGK